MNMSKQLSPFNPQRGVTLIEMMVAMLVGVILLGGVAAVYLGSKQTYGARGGLSILQENGRIALKRLQAGVLGAGYPLNAGIAPVVNDPPWITVDRPGNIDGDILTVSLMSSGAIYEKDCLGQDSPGRILNRYFVQRDAQGNPRLMCEGSGNPGQPQPIAEAVDNMQVLYGVDTDTDGFANQYLNADAVANWLNVVSIQVALLINSIDNVKDVAPGAGNEDQFNLLGLNHVAPNDRLARRTFTTTIPLRNRTPLLQ